MTESIHQFACPPLGSFKFTPEGYAKCADWKPDDSWSWQDFGQGSFSSIEEFEAAKADFEASTAGKTEITKHTYWGKSLRQLLPNRWGFVYVTNKSWREVDGKKVPLYSKEKLHLYFKSIVLGYGHGPIHRIAPTKSLARYIKEHCASSARLKAIALRAYESVANCLGYSTWTSMGSPVFLCLAAAHSSLDSMAAVIWALLFKEGPTDRATPSMSSLYRKLCPNGEDPLGTRLAFGNEFAKLYRSKWFHRLTVARDSLVHRAASPVYHDKFGVAFDRDLGMFKDSQPGFHSAPARVKMGRKMTRIHLDKLMRDFIIEVEGWERRVARSLAGQAGPCLNDDGILLGIPFSENGQDLHDGSGPNHCIRSGSKALSAIESQRMRRRQNKTKVRSRVDTSKP